MATTSLATAEDLWSMNDEQSFELIRGVLHPMPPTGEEHTEVALGIGAALRQFVRARRLGTVAGADGGFIIRRCPDTVLVPDAAFVSAERLPADRDRTRFVPVPPDIAVEVISPSESRRQVLEKVALYLEAGVKLVWIVDLRIRVVTVYGPDGATNELTAGDTLEGGDVLPGFRLPLSEIFDE